MEPVPRPTVVWRGARTSEFLLIEPDLRLPTRGDSGVVEEMGLVLASHELPDGSIAQAAHQEPLVPHRWVSIEDARALDVSEAAIALLEQANEWIDTHTWDGLPIAQDWPMGATVTVWRPSPAGVELLLLHRAHHGPDYAGDWAWTSPAGARQPGENVEAAAARELHEEAGLALPTTRIDDNERWARFVAQAPVDEDVTLHDAEHDRYVWVSPAEAREMISPLVVREGLDKALAHIDEDR